MIVGYRITHERSQHRILEGDKYEVIRTIETLHSTKGWKKHQRDRGSIPKGSRMPLFSQRFERSARPSKRKLPPRPPMKAEDKRKSLMRHGWYRRATRKQAAAN